MKIGVSGFRAPSFWDYLDVASKTGIRYLECPGEAGNWGWGRDRKPGTGYYFPKEYADSSGMPTVKLRERIESYNLRVNAIRGEFDLVTTKKIQRQREIKRIIKACDVANYFECDIIRLGFYSEVLGLMKSHLDLLLGTNFLDKCVELTIVGLKEAVKYAEDRGVYLALENHGILVPGAKEMLRIFEDVGSECLKALVDTGNFLSYGLYDIETLNHFFEMLAPHTIHTHLKDGFRGPKSGEWDERYLGEGEVNFKLLINLLKRRKYKRGLNIQYESLNPHIGQYEGLKRSLEYLKSIL